MKKLVYFFGSIILLIILAYLCFIIPNKLITSNASSKVYDDVSSIPKNKVGLVLGTSKYLRNGRLNLYYKYRIEATVKLFKQGKIDFVLVSGDNGTKSYDEPTTFKKDLIKRGIPAKKIYLDYAGFRTLDSVVRAKKVFGQSSITFISQQFHNERAIYLAEANDIQAVGFNAQDLPKHLRIKTMSRERLARVKVFIDLLLGVEPKFLGKKIEIK